MTTRFQSINGESRARLARSFAAYAIRAARRQHYHQANAAQKPRLPVLLALLVIVACFGIAGRFAS